MYSKISEIKKQNVLEYGKSAYDDCFCIIAETDTKNSEKLTFCDNNDNCVHQLCQQDTGKNTINLLPFALNEQHVTHNIH